jgi:hypothetical protein
VSNDRPQDLHPGLLLATLLLASMGAAVNAATLDNVAGLTDRTVVAFAVVLLPFAGFAWLAGAARSDRVASVTATVTTGLATALALGWYTEPFGEFTGLAGLLVIPLQAVLWVPTALRLLVVRYRAARATPRA